MIYTSNRIDAMFTALVNKYISGGYHQEWKSLMHNYNHLKYATLVNNITSSYKVIIHFSSEPNYTSNDYFITPLTFRVDHYINDTLVTTDWICKVYWVDTHCYTDSLDELKFIRDIQTNRFIAAHDHKYISQHFKYDKMSPRLQAYITESVIYALSIQNKSADNFKIYDIYASYGANNYRKIIIVIKRADSIATEAIYLNV